ncbi:hypothetical protein ACFXPJ_06410, partial [Streptomyces goshikiensis]
RKAAGVGSGTVMRDEDIVPVALAEDQHEAILTSQILPAWTRVAVTQDHPAVVIRPWGTAVQRLTLSR